MLQCQLAIYFVFLEALFPPVFDDVEDVLPFACLPNNLRWDLQGKESEPMVLIASSGAILILAGAAYIMSMKDNLSLKKAKGIIDER